MNLAEKISNIFISKSTSHQENVEVIEEKIASVNNLKDLFKVFEFIKSLNLNFKNQKFIKYYMYIFSSILFGVLLVGFIFTSRMPLSQSSFDASKHNFFLFFGLLLLGIIYSRSILRQVLNTTQISDSIVLKKVALDNDLEFDKSDKKELTQSFESQFFIFQQGNCSREIKRYIKGEYANKFFYHYFNFHYVDAHTSTSTDTNRNKTSSTTYSHYDLYGIMIPFSSKNFIKISNYELDFKFKKFIRWNTSSISFNKKFKIYANSEQAVALFLQPRIIEQIEELYETFTQLDIEISPHGFLALATPDKELLNYSRHYGLDQLDLFKEEIKNVLDQTKLHKALKFISSLKENHKQT